MSLTNHADSAQYTGKLKYLVYTSIASPDLTEESVQSMLAAAREHNASAEITGLLLFRTGTFIQFLEGAAEEIDQLIGRIRRDDRHQDVRVIIEEPVDHRRFPDWRMGYRVPLEPNSLRQANVRDSFTDITSDSRRAVIERAAREFSLWFKVTEASGSH